MTRDEFNTKYTEENLREIAENYAKEVVIRSYVNGSSNDECRNATALEKKIIANIIFAALIAYGFRSEKNGGSLEAILDMAEFTCHQFLPEVNAYDSVYTPLRKITETW